MKRRILLIIFVLTIALCPHGYGSLSDSREMRIAVTSRVNSLDPIKQDDVTSTSIIVQIFDGLFGYNNRGQLIPVLVDEWSVSEDRKVYKLTLRDDIRFSNGETLNSKHVIDSIERLASKESLNSWAASMISGHEEYKQGLSDTLSGLMVYDNRRLSIELVEPYEAFMHLLSSVYYSIVNEVDAHAIDDKGCGKIYGTGPYRCAAYNSNGVYLKHNANYHSELNNIPSIEYTVMPWCDSVDAFNNGEIDLIRYYNDDYAVDAENSSVEVVYQFSTWYNAFNLQKKVAQDDRFRTAIALTLDKAKLIGLAGRSVDPARGMLPDGFGKAMDDEASLHVYDGVDDPRDGLNVDGVADLLVCKSTPKYEEIIKEYSRVFEELGVKYRVHAEEFTEYYRKRREGEFTIVYANVIPSYGDPDAIFFPYFHSSSKGNITRHGDEHLDDLIMLSRKAPNGIERARINHDIDRYLIEKTYVIPLYHDYTKIYYNKDLALPSTNGLGSWFIIINRTRWKS